MAVVVSPSPIHRGNPAFFLRVFHEKKYRKYFDNHASRSSCRKTGINDFAFSDKVY